MTLSMKVVRGRLVSGRQEELDKATISLPLNPALLYEERMYLDKTMDYAGAEAIADTLWTGFDNYPDIKILGVYAEAGTNMVLIQFTGSQSLKTQYATGKASGLDIASVAPIAGSLLGALGYLLIFIIVLVFISTVPSWAWTFLVLAAGVGVAMRLYDPRGINRI